MLNKTFNLGIVSSRDNVNYQIYFPRVRFVTVEKLSFGTK